MQNNKPSGTQTNKSRRTFMLLLPLAAMGGVFATVATAALRFLRPVIPSSSEKWIDVAQVAELGGHKPVARRIVAEQVAGWAKSLAERSVYILPGPDNRVLSSVCPHEGCE